MDELTRRKKNLITFPLGTVGRDMVYYLFNSCIITFVMFTRNLTNAQFAAITAIVVAARVFDALNDPIMGNIIERTRSRYGKFKPWLVIGMLSTAAEVIAAFNTKLQGWSCYMGENTYPKDNLTVSIPTMKSGFVCLRL